MHTRPAKHRGRLTVAATTLLGLTGAATAVVTGLPSLDPAPPVTRVAAPAATFTYQPAAYRKALEQNLRHPLTDTAFTALEIVSAQVCGWDRDEFAGYVAMNTDDGTLTRLHIDVFHRCPHREPEIADTLGVIADARGSCTLPASTTPEIRAMVDGKPAQKALTCVLLTRPGTD